MSLSSIRVFFKTSQAHAPCSISRIVFSFYSHLFCSDFSFLRRHLFVAIFIIICVVFFESLLYFLITSHEGVQRIWEAHVAEILVEALLNTPILLQTQLVFLEWFQTAISTDKRNLFGVFTRGKTFLKRLVKLLLELRYFALLNRLVNRII